MGTVMTLGQTDVSAYFIAIETSSGKRRDGTLASVIAYNTAALSINYTRERAATVSAVTAGSPAPATLAAATTAHADWGFFHCGKGLCRVDFPDAAFAASGSPKFVSLDVDGPSDTSFYFAGLCELSGVDTRSATAPDVNATKFGGTTVTGRDLGLSVLLSSGTGTGQLDITSGVVKANLSQILGTALTETAGLIAAGFKQFFNIATPTGTVNSVTSIKTKTDQLTFTKANELDANLQSVNGVTVNGDGSGTPMGV
jgi:hypothetical protein